MQKKSIKIVFVTDKTYFDYTLVAIKSIMDNTNSKVAIKIFLSYDETSLKLDEVVKYFSVFSNLTIIFEKFDYQKIKGIKTKKHVSPSAYIKIFLPELIYDWDKVIYLDSDLLIVDDIKKLWDDPSLGNKPISAAWNPKYTYDNEFMGLEKNEKTFNSGVMLLNIARMRELNSTNLLLEFTKEKNEFTKLNDQAAFNAVFARNWGDLPLKWNVTYQFFLHNAKYLGLSRKEKKEILKEASIIHFTTGSKPWKFRSCHPYKRQFNDILFDVLKEKRNEEVTFLSFLKKTYEAFRLCLANL